MTCSRVPGAALLAGALALALVFSACDDPTDVGGELVGGEGFGPQRAEFPLTVDTARYAPTTGTATPGQLDGGRFLAGRQEAGTPLGDVEATGYVDFARVSTPVGLVGLTLDSVVVNLAVNYVYGDTTEAPTFSLHDMTEEWDPSGATADTSFGEGIVEEAPITTFSASAGDTLALTLPTSWVQEHRSELQTVNDTAFGEDFHGFQVRHAAGSGVVGFSSNAASMRAVYEPEGEDEGAPEANFGITEQLTTVRYDRAQTLGDEHYLIQDGTGRALNFEISLPDSLSDVAVNGAEIIFEVDSTLASLPSSFVRPRLETLDFYGATLDDDGELTDPGRLPNSPRFVFDADSSRFVSGFSLRALVQNALLGTPSVDRFQLRPFREVASTPFGTVLLQRPTLNSALIRRDPGHEPRLVLTYTPTETE